MTQREIAEPSTARYCLLHAQNVSADVGQRFESSEGFHMLVTVNLMVRLL